MAAAISEAGAPVTALRDSSRRADGDTGGEAVAAKVAASIRPRCCGGEPAGCLPLLRRPPAAPPLLGMLASPASQGVTNDSAWNRGDSQSSLAVTNALVVHEELYDTNYTNYTHYANLH